MSADGNAECAPRARSIAASRVSGLAAHRRDRDRELGGLALDRVAPVVVEIAHLQQAVARAQASGPARRPAPECSLSIASTSRSKKRRRSDAAPSEQPVHRRRQPHHAQMIAERGGRTHRLAVDAAAPAGARQPRCPAHRCRCRAWRARARPRPRPTPPRSRRPGCRRHRRAWRGAGRVPATETRSPRCNWSCRRRSARPAPPRRRRVCRLAAR